MPAPVPRHVAIIMDGNGRWAEARGRSRIEGHEAGAETVRAVTRACRAAGVEALTLYGFSTENWRRPDTEVAALMGLLGRYLAQERDELRANGVRLRAVGQLGRLPAPVRTALSARMDDTADGAGMTLTLALSYGGRADLVAAARALARDVARGVLAPDDIDEAAFARALDSALLPDVDLLIRTSGELRLSNFLPWQLAYAELWVTDVAWPDFGVPELERAFQAWRGRERRFGRTGAQLREGVGPA